MKTLFLISLALSKPSTVVAFLQRQTNVVRPPVHSTYAHALVQHRRIKTGTDHSYTDDSWLIRNFMSSPPVDRIEAKLFTQAQDRARQQATEWTGWARNVVQEMIQQERTEWAERFGDELQYLKAESAEYRAQAAEWQSKYEDLLVGGTLEVGGIQLAYDGSDTRDLQKEANPTADKRWLGDEVQRKRNLMMVSLAVDLHETQNHALKIYPLPATSGPRASPTVSKPIAGLADNVREETSGQDREIDPTYNPEFTKTMNLVSVVALAGWIVMSQADNVVGAIDGFSGIVKGETILLQSLAHSLATTCSDSASHLSQLHHDMISSLVAAASEAKEWVVHQGHASASTMGQATGTLWNNCRAICDNQADLMKKNADLALEMSKVSVSSIWVDLGRVAGNLKNGLQEYEHVVKHGGQIFIDSIKADSAALARGTTEVSENLMKYMQNDVTTVLRDTADEFRETAKQAAQDIERPILQGISSTSGSVKAFADAMLDSASLSYSAGEGIAGVVSEIDCAE